MAASDHHRRTLALVYHLGAGLASIGLATGAIVDTRPAEAAFPGKNGKIAFTSSRDGNLEIYSMNPDGSNQQRLTNNAVDDDASSWQPLH